MSWMFRWLAAWTYSPYDLQGDLKHLRDRLDDATQCDLPGVPPDVRDRALRLFCESFDIPLRQMHRLRPDDELFAIYRIIVGPSICDDCEFERLDLALYRLSGREPAAGEYDAIKTIGDLIRFVAACRR